MDPAKIDKASTAPVNSNTTMAELSHRLQLSNIGTVPRPKESVECNDDESQTLTNVHRYFEMVARRRVTERKQDLEAETSSSTQRAPKAQAEAEKSIIDEIIRSAKANPQKPHISAKQVNSIGIRFTLNS